MKNPFKKEIKAPVKKVAPAKEPEVLVPPTKDEKEVVIDNDAEYDYETRGKKVV